MNQNEKYKSMVIGICADAAKLTKVWESFRMLFSEYTDELIEVWKAAGESWQNPFLKAVPSQIMTVEDTAQHPMPNRIKLGTEAHMRPQRVRMRYNYIPRTVRNQPYQRRAY